MQRTSEFSLCCVNQGSFAGERLTKVSSSPQVPFRAMLLRYLSYCSSRKGANSSGWALTFIRRVSFSGAFQPGRTATHCILLQAPEPRVPGTTRCKFAPAFESSPTSCSQWRSSALLCDSLECHTAQKRWHGTAAPSNELYRASTIEANLSRLL